ncbi:MAG: hypothetical protein HZB14_06765, partial [Actinobacteria bacterium]|nr:hypothetical protein [Actinomycetota bacterium]
MLTNPDTCSAKTFNATISPHSAGTDAARTSGYTTTGCPAAQFTPTFTGSVTTTAAGAHPDLTLTVTRPDFHDQLRNLNLHLPTGLAANTSATTQCSQANAAAGNCLASQQVGTVSSTIGSGASMLTINGFIYNVVPSPGEPARLQAILPVTAGPFNLGSLSIPVTTSLRADWGIDTATTLPLLYEGVPVRMRQLQMVLNGTAGGNSFMTNPSKCQVNTVSADMVSPAPATVTGSFNFTTTGCPQAFNPSVTAAVTTTETAKPTGLTLGINVPANNSSINRVQTALPAGMTINPAVGNGPLQACSAALIDAGGAGCPATSDQGNITLTTPLLSAPVTGDVYLETPGVTPATRYKLALVIRIPGRNLVVHGSAQVNGSGLGADSGTGQITADFNGIPDLGFSSMSIAFNSGNRAMFVNPETCGSKTVSMDLTPNTTGGAVATRTANFTTDYNGSGGACPGTDPHTPGFTVGVSTTVAGAHPDLTMTVTRTDKHQQIRNLNLHLPVGLVANTSATTQCSQANAAIGACLASQQVGTITTAVGSGAETYSLSGQLYNVVPNAGEPARLYAEIPVVVGPFDLGAINIPVPTSLRADFGIDASTQLPLMWEGVPVRIRTLQMVLSGTVGGNSFMTNPSKCQVNTVTADVISPAPATASVSSSYTTTGCPQTFNPSISASVSTTETAKPTGLTLGINVPVNNSTVSRVQTTLPVGMDINPAAGNGPLQACSAALIDAGGAGCPATSDQGNVTLTTPLLPASVTGDIYLETPGATPATRYKLAIVLRLPGRNLVIHGSAQVSGSGLGADSGTGQVTADFNGIPDLGFTNMTLAFSSGNRALFTNPETCGSKTVSMDLTPNTTGGAVATRTANFTTDYNGSGGACPGSDPWAPTFGGSVSTTAAGGHPDLTMTVTRTDKNQQLRNLNMHLPTGLVANTSATTQCSQANAAAGTCLASQQVGSVSTTVGSGAETYSLSGGIYNVVPNASEPARLQVIIPVVVGPFDLGTLSIPVTTSLRADFGIDANAQIPLRYEGVPVRVRTMTMVLNGTVGGNSFVTNPSKCQVNTVSADMISPAPTTVTGSFNYTTTGCPTTFNPNITATVSTTETAKPTGLTLGINVPVNNSTVSRVQTTLPVGMDINPAAGNGPLQACSAALIDAGGAGCPATSDQGNVTLTTPLLPSNVTGDIYLETPGATPATRYKLAIVLRIPSRNLVIHGSAQVNGSGLGADSGTGQVTADFNGIPDLGFTNMTLAFTSGNRALFTNPETCGSKTVSMDLTPNTTGGAVATRTANFTTDYNGSGGACPGSDPWAPTFGGSVSTTAAGAHPDLTMTVTRTDKNQQLRNLNLHLPTGLVANTSATTQCSQANAAIGACLASQQVGTITTAVGSGAETFSLSGQLYNVVPNAGEPARLYAEIPVVVGPFDLGAINIPVSTSLRADWGIDASTQIPLRWEGVPVRIRTMQMVLSGTVGGNSFVTNPSKCQVNTVSADMISPAPTTVTGSFNYTTTGCPQTFNPSISASVSTTETAKPTGLTLGINVPVNNSTVNRVQTTLPAGMELNPAAGNGPLQACATATIDAGGAGCPATSDQGNVTLTTPLLPSNVTGDIYLETPGATPATRYKLAIVLRIPGRNLVIHGSAQVNGSGLGADSGTGQVTADFNGIPDLGFTNLTLAFSSGNRALFVNPTTCGSKTVSMDLTPNTTGGAVATRTANFTTDYNGSGGACPGSDPWSPSFTGSVSTTAAGGNPNVTLNVTRADKSQQLREFNVHLPAGMVANATAVPQCTQASAAAGTCASTQPGSQVGTISTTIGSGAETFSISSGGIYNVVPNLNEPARLQAILPVVVGPFDLGSLSIPVLTSLRPDMGVDAETQIPLRYEGIAVRIRTMNMVLSGIVGGNGFMINPSKCQVNTVNADMVSDSANTATGSFNFTTNGCPSNFVSSPTITANVSPSETQRSTGLTLGINSSASNPTIGRVQLTLPSGMEINPAVGNGPLQACSAAAIDAGGAACPATSNLGSVSLITPLLTGGQSGNIYLETPGATAATRYKLAIVVHLPGQDLVVRGTAQVNGSSDHGGGAGSVDTGTGRVTADFPAVPDLSFTNMTIAFNTGNRALLLNPAACGTHTVNATISPNSGGVDATPSATFGTSYDGLGAACPGSDPFAPVFTGSVSTTASGGNPDLTLNVTHAAKSEHLRNFNLHLPSGMVANTVDTPRCPQASAAAGSCGADTVVGSIVTEIGSGAETLALSGTINNVIPNASEPARLAAIVPVVVGPFDLGKLSIPVPTSLRNDYGVDTTTQIPNRYEGIAVRIRSLALTIDGVADQGTPSTADDQPFMINPTECQSNTLTADMISASATTVIGSFNFSTTGCPKAWVTQPTITAAVAPSETAKPTGLTLGIQNSASNPTLERVRVTLPVGMEINPAVANGPLQTCSAALIDAGGAGCPATSVQGTVNLTTPLLPTVQTGNVYLENPGGTAATRYKLAIVIHLPGKDLILHGGATVDGSSDHGGGVGSVDTGTGQVVADFNGIPDLGFTDLQIVFNTGDRALLTNPKSCGSHSVSAAITPHGGGSDATPSGSFTTSYDGLGAACPGSDPFAP